MRLPSIGVCFSMRSLAPLEPCSAFVTQGGGYLWPAVLRLRRQPKGKPVKKWLTKAPKAAIVFTDQIKEITTGVILGDGYLAMAATDARLKVQVRPSNPLGQAAHQKDKEFV